jgi:hypothetical protein
MKALLPLVSGALLIALSTAGAGAQNGSLQLPGKLEAGSEVSFEVAGNGKGTLLIVGVGQVIKRDVQLDNTIRIPAGTLYRAGHYIVLLKTKESTSAGTIDVIPAGNVATLTFLAKPSRLPVGAQGGITGTVYTLDAYQNLVTSPAAVSFELANPGGPVQQREVETRNGAAWAVMDSSSREGKSMFVARAGPLSSTRVIGQVAGDPCTLKMSARPSGEQIEVTTEPVRDCSGNSVSDGTIVTFTESHDSYRSTVDVPLKRGIARALIPAHRGATISVASGVVLGNEVRWEK